MFTGFIKETGLIEQVTPLDSGAELIIQISSQFAADIPLQSHLAIDGRVFTVLGKEQHHAFTCLKFSASHLDKAEPIPAPSQLRPALHYTANSVEMAVFETRAQNAVRPLSPVPSGRWP